MRRVVCSLLSQPIVAVASCPQLEVAKLQAERNLAESKLTFLNGEGAKGLPVGVVTGLKKRTETTKKREMIATLDGKIATLDGMIATLNDQIKRVHRLSYSIVLVLLSQR